jgi:hypothetical protein
VSLRGHPVEESARLADGREVRVRVGVPNDSYVKKRDLNTVAVELFAGERPLASVNTILNPGQTNEARKLAREIVTGLEEGTLEPTAGAIEPLADRLR